MDVPVVRLDSDLPLPTRTHVDDAGLDLLAREGTLLARRGGRAGIPTGLSVSIPGGLVGLVVPRSGLAVDHGVTVLNSPGVIDSGYRGELVVILINLDPENDYVVRRGDRIAQLVLLPTVTAELDEVPELPASNRGPKGLGHSGR